MNSPLCHNTLQQCYCHPLALQVLVQRLQKDILPKIESQIAELSKQDEPNDATKAITKQLKV